MIWLEMISIRTAGTTETKRALEICRQVYLAIVGETLLRAAVFCNIKYPTDISVHIYWKSDPGTGSVLGRELSSALEDLGLINYTIWSEQEELNNAAAVDMKSKSK